MTATTDIRDCVKLAAAVKSLGGAVPDPLQYLLSAHALLSSPAATPHPESAIVDAALDGSLTEAKLQELLPVAATAAMTAGYARQLARDCEHVLIGAWHRAMKAGAADQVLDSLRKNFTTHAKAIAHARELIDPN
jgi:hypothetical protein